MNASVISSNPLNGTWIFIIFVEYCWLFLIILKKMRFKNEQFFCYHFTYVFLFHEFHVFHVPARLIILLLFEYALDRVIPTVT